MSRQVTSAVATLESHGYIVVLKPVKQVRLKRRDVNRISEILSRGERAVVSYISKSKKVTVFSFDTYKAKVAVAAKARAGKVKPQENKKDA